MKTMKRNISGARSSDGSVTLSTETPCPQDGLILLSSGWDLSRFDKVPPKMFFNHAAHGSTDYPIGKWENVKIEDGKLKATPVFAVDEHPERAGVIAKLWDGGFLDDVSVSFSVDTDKLGTPMKLDDGRVYQVSGHHSLLECSIVGIGADPMAGKGRIAEAVQRGVITESEAHEFDPEVVPDAVPYREEAERLKKEGDALRKEVDDLRNVLETLRNTICRLQEGMNKQVETVTPAAAPSMQNKNNEPGISHDDARKIIRDEKTKAVNAVVNRIIKKIHGKLPD